MMVIIGVQAVAYAFPKVKMISAALDEKVNDLYHIIPGVGEQKCVIGSYCIYLHYF